LILKNPELINDGSSGIITEERRERGSEDAKATSFPSATEMG
jgi:hypothetical protein